jgi:hypothetical protein
MDLLTAMAVAEGSFAMKVSVHAASSPLLPLAVVYVFATKTGVAR